MNFILTVTLADKTRQTTSFDSMVLAQRAANRAMGNGAVSAVIA